MPSGAAAMAVAAAPQNLRRPRPDTFEVLFMVISLAPIVGVGVLGMARSQLELEEIETKSSIGRRLSPLDVRKGKHTRLKSQKLNVAVG